jgi:type II secretory ATPase GspE/PulE/Tfp pilus assembly ATPase PilB-like protein
LFEDFAKEIEGKSKAGEEGIPDLVETLLQRSLEIGATDLHIECRREGALIKIRMDGVLYPVATIPLDLMDNVVARLKVLAKVKTFDRRSPQDGRIELAGETGSFFLRASFLPTLHGEKVAVRFPDLTKLDFELEDLGFREEDLIHLSQFIESRQGTLLLTGPISSGKTTTIYSILKRLVRDNREGLSISTLEDPIEAAIEGISQTQIDPAGGLTYSTGLRMLLRQDADVLVVGEIRDEETARMAIRAGLIGHLVISTIHSPDAAGTFTRLINMGMEPFLITSSVSTVVGQRLMRRLCPECKKERNLSPEEQKLLIKYGVSVDNVYSPGGCPQCHMTGYKARMGIFEVLYMSESMRNLILLKSPTRDIRREARKSGMIPLARHAAQKVSAGETSLGELMRLIIPG